MAVEVKEYPGIKKGIEGLMKKVIQEVDEFPLQKQLLDGLLDLRGKLDGRSGKGK